MFWFLIGSGFKSPPGSGSGSKKYTPLIYFRFGCDYWFSLFSNWSGMVFWPPHQVTNFKKWCYPSNFCCRLHGLLGLFFDAVKMKSIGYLWNIQYSSVADPDWIRIQIIAWIRIRIQQVNFSCFEAYKSHSILQIQPNVSKGLYLCQFVWKNLTLFFMP